jgi:hypothetical protein
MHLTDNSIMVMVCLPKLIKWWYVLQKLVRLLGWNPVGALLHTRRRRWSSTTGWAWAPRTEEFFLTEFPRSTNVGVTLSAQKCFFPLSSLALSLPFPSILHHHHHPIIPFPYKVSCKVCMLWCVCVEPCCCMECMHIYAGWEEGLRDGKREAGWINCTRVLILI